MTVPRLDLTPKLKRPLSLWNPLDYLRLLYWVFFFPQALPWYVRKFGKIEDYAEKVAWRRFLNILRTDIVQRNLFIQTNLLILIVLVGISYVLQIVRGEFDWIIVAIIIGFGIAVGVVGSHERGFAVGAVLGVAASLGMFSFIAGALFSAAASLAVSVTVGVVISVTVSAAAGMAAGMAFNVAMFGTGRRMLGVDVMFDMFFGVLFGAGLVIVVLAERDIAGGTIRGIAGVTAEDMSVSVAFGVTFGVAMGLAISRFFPDYVLFYFPHWFSWKIAAGKTMPALSHIVWLPLPGLEEKLLDWLRKDPLSGIHNLNQILTYSLQVIPSIHAVNYWLAEQPPEKILASVNDLVEKLLDWQFLIFASLSLRAVIWRDIVGSMPEDVQKSFDEYLDTSLLLSTPAQAACAGYWYLHKKDVTAVNAFRKITHLSHGAVLFRSYHALFRALENKTLSEIAKWHVANAWLENMDEEPLRPQAVQTLRRLRSIALEAAVARESLSKLNRSAALGRAVSTLTELIDDVEETCPYPEHPIVKDIAVQWRDVLALAAGQAGQIAITRPVENPFVVGNPVSGQAFVGREEIFQRLEELWGSAGNRQVASVVLFGHRRMGKSSILQNLRAHRFGARTLVAYFTMQRAPRLENTGQFLGYLVLAIHDVAASAGIRLDEPNLDTFRADGYLSFNAFLRQLKTRLGGRRVILAIDEFESIEAQIASRRLDAELLDFLRGVIHSEPWLILVLAGLHTLEEMTADYWNPLFASVTPIKVSFLSLGATAGLLANPHPDFPLDFTHDTVRRIYEHARGQPYLTQLVGHTLVRRYNQEVFERQRPRSPQFTPAEVDEIIASPEFYEQGSYYFSGVWTQAEKGGPPGQTALLRALASAPAPLGNTDLFHASGLDYVTGQAALETLIRHDVISRAEGVCDFTVPLLRQWVKAHAPKA